MPSKTLLGDWIYARPKVRKEIGSESGSKEYVGKWLVFRRREEIDEVWAQIREATNNGKLGSAAKVSTEFHRQQGGKPDDMRCVYTRDFRERNDVDMVLKGLREFGIKGKLHDKTDQATLAGVYASTGERASLYSSDDFER